MRHIILPGDYDYFGGVTKPLVTTTTAARLGPYILKITGRLSFPVHV
jgi:hypothetical protein